MQPTLKSLPLYSTILDNYSPVFSFSFSEKCEKMISLQLMRTLEEIDYLDLFSGHDLIWRQPWSHFWTTCAVARMKVKHPSLISWQLSILLTTSG